MSAYKKFNKQDVFVSSYNARKKWEVSGSLHDEFNIFTLAAYSSSNQYYPKESDLYSASAQLDPTGSYPNLVYKSLDQLYYRSFYSASRQYSGSIFTSSFYDNHIESSFTSASRFLNVSASVFSLPKELIGTHIEPSTVHIEPGGTNVNQVFDADTFEEEVFVTDSYPYLSLDGDIYDDGDGILYVTSSAGFVNVGNVIYSHGQLIITHDEVARYYINRNNVKPTLRWKSNQPIYTYNYHCKVKDAEFNMTQNPSITSGSSVTTVSGSSYFRSSGLMKSFATGSQFQPYFTSVGLYNDANELIAVAKLGKAVPKSTNSDMTVVVKLDI
jgi:hypothetical protein